MHITYTWFRHVNALRNSSRRVVVAYAFTSSTQEAEATDLQVQGQPSLQS